MCGGRHIVGYRLWVFLYPMMSPNAPEPVGTDLGDGTEVPVAEVDWPEEEEPEGDALSWAVLEDDTNPADAWLDVVPEDEPSDWSDVDVASVTADAWDDWGAEPLPRIGWQEQAALPALNRASVPTAVSTQLAHSVLHTPDPALHGIGDVSVELLLVGQRMTVSLQVVPAAEERLVIGRDILAGRFVVDVALSGASSGQSRG